MVQIHLFPVDFGCNVAGSLLCSGLEIQLQFALFILLYPTTMFKAQTPRREHMDSMDTHTVIICYNMYYIYTYLFILYLYYISLIYQYTPYIYIVILIDNIDPWNWMVCLNVMSFIPDDFYYFMTWSVRSSSNLCVLGWSSRVMRWTPLKRSHQDTICDAQWYPKKWYNMCYSESSWSQVS